MNTITANDREAGYFLARDLLPQKHLNELSAAIFECCQDAGWLATTATSASPVAAASLPPIDYQDPRFTTMQQQVLANPAFAALRDLTPVLSLITGFLDGPVKPEQGDLCRVVAPKQPPTPAHQDGHYTGAGEDACTLWAPLHDCGPRRGCLAVAPGSANLGALPHTRTEGREAGVGENAALRWYMPTLRTGDALLFSHRTVHRAALNESPLLRFSVELRYRRC